MERLFKTQKKTDPSGPMSGRSVYGCWIPYASYRTTGQFMHLEGGFKRHCGPTAAVNVIRTLEKSQAGPAFPEKSQAGPASAEKSQAGPASPEKSRTGFRAAAKSGAARASAGNPEEISDEQLFLLCAKTGRRTLAYWNKDILGRFGGTSNFLTGIFVRRCLRAVGVADQVSVHFHPWISPSAVEKALRDGAMVYLQVYHHPRYKNHHMLCYACAPDPDSGDMRYLLADGWTGRPVWTDAAGLGHGHFLTIRRKTP